MMYLVAAVFVLAYSCIALEHVLKINKSAIALIAAGLMWTLYAAASPLGIEAVSAQLTEKLAETAAIVFFLIGAMTIVEVTDSHGGFEVITSRIKAGRLSSLLWVVAGITFLLSAILDNMTTTIVMVALMKRLLNDRGQRLFFAGIIVIAANAGGAWTPIGDVTTTMLWIGGQITTANIMKTLLLPSLVNLLLPLAVASFGLKGHVVPPDRLDGDTPLTSPFEKNLMFVLGMGSLMFVPVFKATTHLPPYLGILLSLGMLWLIGNILHRNKPEKTREPLRLARALKRIDMASVVFFIGILLAVSALSANGMLPALAAWLQAAIGNQGLIVVIIGLISAVVDNIPLVAASMGMYPLAQFPADSFIWEFLAYCAGTGGSLLIIGSAAGVAAMGQERIEFFWYARRIGPLALLGYFGGIACYLAQYSLAH
ncbi:sodium:proton antiporter NhaD [Desulfobulbus sp.]|uniref:sodium:proton antiporter NhaD n=1 Tax=Desulfobulbus sp. TaxID=895 RepID=UPI00286F1EA8|nr:sodium:proton antiporter NhaD [Desulfobulbus sp.]